MRMPFLEFITSGDLKFIVVFIIFISIAFYHFFKKLQAKESIELNKHHNSKISIAAFWILILSSLSLLLGLMHSFYFIGKTGGIAPSLIFQGVSYALITPVLGVCLFIVSKFLQGTFNPKTIKS